jgi:enoyl-CoA hydratase
MSDATISIERRGHVLLIGLNRAAKRNAFTLEMLHSLSAAYGELERDPELRCGLLFAHGDHFTAGLDLADVTPAFKAGGWSHPDGGVDPLSLSGTRLTKPIVSAVQGICFTIGIELMLATEIRVAAADTRFAMLEVKRGIYPVGGATIRMVREAGWSNAMRYLLTGDEFNADEALRLNLIQEIVPVGQQFERALELAERVAKQAPLGVRAVLAAGWHAVLDGEDAAAKRLLPDLQPLMNSEDASEGLMSFLERREARFQGK